MSLVPHKCKYAILIMKLLSFFNRDRFRTMTNVTGDSLGAGIVYYLSKNELPPLHTEEQEYEMHVTSNKRKSVPNGTDAMTAV